MEKYCRWHRSVGCAVGTEDATPRKFSWANFGKIRQIWAKFGQIWAKVIKIWASLIRFG